MTNMSITDYLVFCLFHLLPFALYALRPQAPYLLGHCNPYRECFCPGTNGSNISSSSTNSRCGGVCDIKIIL